MKDNKLLILFCCYPFAALMIDYECIFFTVSRAYLVYYLPGSIFKLFLFLKHIRAVKGVFFLIWPRSWRGRVDCE
jgi:hypothetical protein